MKPEFRFPDERVAFWVPLAIRAAQVTPGGFGPRVVARMKPGTDRAALVAQLEPLARRVQQRLGGPAPYVRIMERHRPVVKPLREHLVGKISTPLWILLGTVGDRVPDRVRERGQPVHGARGEPASRPGGAPRARSRTRRPGALTGDRGAAARGGGRRGSARSSPGLASRSWSARRRMPSRAALAARPFPDSPPRAWTSRRCSSRWASRFWRRARSACCPPSASQARALAAFSRPDEASSAGISRATRWWSCRPPPRSSCWLDRRCSCAASGSSATSTPDTTRRTSSHSRSRPVAPT